MVVKARDLSEEVSDCLFGYAVRLTSQINNSPLTSISDVPARPESRKPAQAEPSEAKLCEAVAGLGVACGSGFTSSKP